LQGLGIGVLTINLQFSDVAWLLGTYQVWLHELYPRAKFADGLAMIEKLGHTKRMQSLRSGWIDESKPNMAQDDDSDHGNISDTIYPGLEVSPSSRQASVGKDVTESLTAENEVSMNAGTNGEQAADTTPGALDDDELDQLLAEEFELAASDPGRNSSISAGLLNANSHAGDRDEFADEDEVMRDLDFD
jgi:replication fork protection complex subunit Csm3/Swi3